MTAISLIPAGEDVSGQDLLEVLGALRRLVDQQERRRGRHHVDHADQRLLRNARRPGRVNASRTAASSVKASE